MGISTRGDGRPGRGTVPPRRPRVLGWRLWHFATVHVGLPLLARIGSTSYGDAHVVHEARPPLLYEVQPGVAEHAPARPADPRRGGLGATGRLTRPVRLVVPFDQNGIRIRQAVSGSADGLDQLPGRAQFVAQAFDVGIDGSG
jgi:hypothetical protein